MPLVTASPGTCPRWTSRDMAMDDRPSRAGVGGAAREPRACPGGWTPAASPPSLNLPTSPLSEPWLSGCQVLSGGLSFATCSTTLNSVQPRRCSQRARTAVLRVQLRWTFVKHACGKL